MTPEELAAVVAKTEINVHEIEKLRDRSHEYGNELQHVVAVIENVNGKLDAIHTSTLGRIAELRAEVKEDITEVKSQNTKIETQTTKTNGHVAEVDRRLSRLQGASAAFAFVVTVGTPVALFLAPHIH